MSRKEAASPSNANKKDSVLISNFHIDLINSSLLTEKRPIQTYDSDPQGNKKRKTECDSYQ